MRLGGDQRHEHDVPVLGAAGRGRELAGLPQDDTAPEVGHP